ncbi:MAG: UbiD family decarboxylase [Archaeoglobus sp.]|nr:UbiD family decarboxylase [Archaeoglobus sp.]
MDYADGLRDALKTLSERVLHFDTDLRYDELTKFIFEKNLRDKPFIVNVEGKKVASNFTATREMLCDYLGICREDLAEYLSRTSYDGDIRISGNPFRKTKWDLTDLPIPKYFAGDGGRYITAGVVIARWDGEKSRSSRRSNDVRSNDAYSAYNACIHRLMLIDSRRMAARLVPPRHTYLLWKDAIKKGKDLPVLIAIGTHPLFMFAASTRVPKGKEFGYAASLMKGLELFEVEGLLTPMAEIVISARITSEKAKEGPFVDLTATYDKIREEPVVEVDAIYARKDPIFYSILPAGYEHQVLMGIPYEPVIYKAVANVCRVKNVILTAGGKHYFHAVVQIEKNTEGDGKNAILAAFSAHPSLKKVIVVDEDIDIYNHEDVEFAIATRFQADKDLVIVKGARGSSLDPSANEDGTTAKWGIDATAYLSRKEDFKRVF